MVPKRERVLIKRDKPILNRVIKSFPLENDFYYRMVLKNLLIYSI